MVLDTIVVFVVSLLIGAVGIYIGARIVVDTTDYTYALGTALLGAIVWAIVGFFFGWIPLLGPILVLIAYLSVVNTRYPGGWGSAIAITLVAWVSVLIVLYALAVVGITGFEAAGVPGI